MQMTKKSTVEKRTTARGYSESQDQAALDNKAARMFGITVSGIFCVLEHVCFSSLPPVFGCFADYSELPKLCNFRIPKNIMTLWPTL